MHLRRTGIAHHLDDLQAGGATHNAVVDQDDPATLNQCAIGIMLQLDAKVTHLLAGRDEGPADIVRADDAEFKRNA